MDYLVSQYVAYYHLDRPHQSLGNEVILKLPGETPPDDPQVGAGHIECRTRLGGLLKHYYRQAA